MKKKHSLDWESVPQSLQFAHLTLARAPLRALKGRHTSSGVTSYTGVFHCELTGESFCTFSLKKNMVMSHLMD